MSFNELNYKYKKVAMARVVKLGPSLFLKNADTIYIEK